MLSVFVRANGQYGKREGGKWSSCFRIGGWEFALIERNVPLCCIAIHSPLFFIICSLGIKVNADIYVNVIYCLSICLLCTGGHRLLLSWSDAQNPGAVLSARCLDDHLVSLRMSGSRKEFDVKQILKIRWRWFSHQASSHSTVDSQQGEFWNRGQTGANGGRKFLDPCSLQLPLASIGYRRSSQLDFQNSPSWPMASTSEVPAFEFTAEDCGGAHWLDRPEVDDGTSEEENESDSSSCRLIIFLLIEMGCGGICSIVLIIQCVCIYVDLYMHTHI